MGWTLPTALAELPGELALPPPPMSFDIDVRLPGSKSLTNRAVLLAALADGESVLRGAMVDGEDAAAMRRGVAELGATLEEKAGALHIHGVGGQWRGGETMIQAGGSGTTMRFLAAAALLANAPVVLDGNARLRQRPMAELGGLLMRLGAVVEYLGERGCPPLRITPPLKRLRAPAVLEVAGFESSQFISALLLVAPWLENGLTLRLKGAVTSASYLHMTLGLLTRLGASVREAEGLRVLRVSTADGHRGVRPFTYDIEPDASGATAFWGAAALMPGARARVMSIDSQSLQGDSSFPEVLGRMGAKVSRVSGEEAVFIEVAGTRKLAPILADMGDMPDAAMTLAVVASFAQGTSILRGLRTLRVKECDRIAALQTELAKIGVAVQSPVHGDDDAMTITPPSGGVNCSPRAGPVVFDTYDDHRMAMALSLIGLRRPGVVVRNPACVGKTYPAFWAEWARLYS